jgi:hypothetical protein
MCSSIARQLAGFVQAFIVSGDTSAPKAVRKDVTIMLAASGISSEFALRTEIIVSKNTLSLYDVFHRRKPDAIDLLLFT